MNERDSLPSDWVIIARKDWNRIYRMLDYAVRYNPELENYRDLCERVSGYYFAERYPPLGDFGLRSEDIKKDLTEAKKFIITMFPLEKL